MLQTPKILFWLKEEFETTAAEERKNNAYEIVSSIKLQTIIKKKKENWKQQQKTVKKYKFVFAGTFFFVVPFFVYVKML